MKPTDTPNYKQESRSCYFWDAPGGGECGIFWEGEKNAEEVREILLMLQGLLNQTFPQEAANQLREHHPGLLEPAIEPVPMAGRN